VESWKIFGDRAELVTRRVEELRALWRTHTVTSRWHQIWKKADNDWMLVEEKPEPT
jgi:hypothetical protein